jgi:hypothetical protein
LKAWCLIRTQPHYRREAFESGLKAAGYQVTPGWPDTHARPGDILVTWNRHFDTAPHALAIERLGGTVVVAENGYLGLCPERRQYYALAQGGHNGSGNWTVGKEDRFAKLGIAVKPWRSNPDGHIQIFGQRGIGSPGMASPPNWHLDIAAKLRKIQKREVRVSLHPGPPAIDPEVTERTVKELQGAYCAVIWSSARGVRALVEGIPVFFDAPYWSCSRAAVRGTGNLDRPCLDDAMRADALHRMAWAQWSVDEIQSGEAFKTLLATSHQTLATESGGAGC